MLTLIEEKNSSVHFEEVMGPMIERIIHPPSNEKVLISNYEEIYSHVKEDLQWTDIQKKFFERGPLIYPNCKIFIDTFKTYADRRDFCIRKNSDYPSVITMYSFNKLYKDRINAVINYATHFKREDAAIAKNLRLLREMYDHTTPEGWRQYEESSFESKKAVANLTTILSFEILKAELL